MYVASKRPHDSRQMAQKSVRVFDFSYTFFLVLFDPLFSFIFRNSSNKSLRTRNDAFSIRLGFRYIFLEKKSVLIRFSFK